MEKRKILMILAILVLSAGMVFAGGGSETGQAADPSGTVKVALLLGGTSNDMTWDYNAYTTLNKIAEKLDYVEILGISESVAEGDAESFMMSYADDGADLIISNSFGFFDAAHKVTAEYSNLVAVFPGGDESLTTEGVGTYYPLTYESTYLVGMTAAMTTKTKKVGFVLSNPIPPLLAELNSFVQGVRDTDPDVSVDVIITGSWFDPTREAESAQALVDTGVDFIAFQLNTLAVLDVAKKEGILVAPPFADQRHLAEDNVAVCSLWNWESYYEDLITKVKNNSWKSSVEYWGIDKGMTDISGFGKMIPADVQKAVLAKRDEIINGSFTVPYIIDKNLWE